MRRSVASGRRYGAKVRAALFGRVQGGRPAILEAESRENAISRLLQTAAKVVPGATVAVIAGWALGKFNNSMEVDLAAKRQHGVLLKNGTVGDFDDVQLSLNLKKTGYTRVRLVECQVQLEANGASETDRRELVSVAAAASASLTNDFRISTGSGVALVPEDAVQFEAHLRIPRDIPVRIRLVIRGKMMLMEWLGIAQPDWASSVVVLPVGSGIP